jgi:membrane protease YdiL (CAAX protease family)
MSSFDSPALPVANSADTHVSTEAGPALPLTPVAPLWHTLVLLAYVGFASWRGTSIVAAADSGKHTTLTYVDTIVTQWLLFGYIWWGLHRRRVRLRDIIGGRWRGPEDFLLDIALAIGFGIVAYITLSTLLLGLTAAPFVIDRIRHGLPVLSGGGLQAIAEGAKKARMSNASRILNLLGPKNGFQLAMSVLLVCTAGIVEEIMFRGYLQRQFGAWTRNAKTGLIASAIIFGLAHAYQGAAGMFAIAVFGAMFGVVAMWRNSLRPGMITHAIFDGFQMLILYALATGAMKMPS